VFVADELHGVLIDDSHFGRRQGVLVEGDQLRAGAGELGEVTVLVGSFQLSALSSTTPRQILMADSCKLRADG